MTPWLGLAAAVHLLLWAVWRDKSSERVAAPKPPTIDNTLELELLPPEKPPQQNSREALASLPGPRDTRAPEPSRRVVSDWRSIYQQPEHVDATSSPAEAASPNASTQQPAMAAPSVNPPAAAEESVAMGPAPASATPPGGATVTAPSAASPTERLAALGYGAPHAAALQPLLNVSPTVMAEDRLNLHLAQAIVDDDRDHSLGIEGPVTNALHTGAMGVVVPKSLSKVVITIGRDGRFADFRIIETNRDARALTALGERVKRLLTNQTVRVPNGRAMEFIYEVKSEVLLPSGRAPGLTVEVLGIPVKKGRDEKSSKISILTPHLEFESRSLPDPDRNGKVTQTLPQLVYGISLLGLDADPVDIAAPERQVVHTRLIQQRVL